MQLLVIRLEYSMQSEATPVYCIGQKAKFYQDNKIEASASSKYLIQKPLSCAQSRNRTSDTRIFSPLLYQLSYLGIVLKRKRSV